MKFITVVSLVVPMALAQQKPAQVVVKPAPAPKAAPARPAARPAARVAQPARVAPARVVAPVRAVPARVEPRYATRVIEPVAVAPVVVTPVAPMAVVGVPVIVAGPFVGTRVIMYSTAVPAAYYTTTLAPGPPPAGVLDFMEGSNTPDAPEGDGWVWADGWWAWDANASQWVWMQGHWDVPPPGRTDWVANYWTRSTLNTGWTLHAGYWE